MMDGRELRVLAHPIFISRSYWLGLRSQEDRECCKNPASWIVEEYIIKPIFHSSRYGHLD